MNTHIPTGGGPYVMISRALGPALGVSVGVVYYIGIAFLALMETLGAVEVMVEFGLDFKGAQQVLPILFILILALCVLLPQRAVEVLGMLFAFYMGWTLIAYFVGLGQGQPSASRMSDNWGPAYADGANFYTVFSLFLPVFMGMLSGADRMALLKDPASDMYFALRRSILSLSGVFPVMGRGSRPRTAAWQRRTCQ